MTAKSNILALLMDATWDSWKSWCVGLVGGRIAKICLLVGGAAAVPKEPGEEGSGRVSSQSPQSWPLLRRRARALLVSHPWAVCQSFSSVFLFSGTF